MLGNWLGLSFLLNNAAVLLICFFTIALPPNTRIYYLFSTLLPISAFIDILSISFNWEIYDDITPGFNFFFSFLMTLVLVLVKVVIAIHQFEIAKTLNNEQSPISLPGLYTSFINAITLQQTPIERKQRHQPGVDIEAPATVGTDTATAEAAQPQASEPAVVNVVVGTANEKKDEAF